jgi:hemolysin III
MTMQQASAGDSSASVPSPRLESRSERRVDAMVHIVGLTLGLAGSIVLAMLALPREASTVLVSLALYGVGLLAMLGCSALYNIGGDGPRKAF